MIYVRAMESEDTWGRVASVTLNIEPYEEVCEEPVPSKTSSTLACLYINITIISCLFIKYVTGMHKVYMRLI